MDNLKLFSVGAPVAEGYVIHATASQGGSIDPSGSVSVAEHGSQTFAIVPDPGYEIADVLVDGESAGAVTQYTFTDVTENHTIAALLPGLQQRRAV